MNPYDFEPKKPEKEVQKKEQLPVNFDLNQVYLWLALGLGITGIVAIVLSNIFISRMQSGAVSEDAFVMIAFVFFFVSIGLMIPSIIIVSVPSFRKNIYSDIFFYFLHALATGAMLGSAFAGNSWSQIGLWTIGLPFLVTAACYALIGILGLSLSRGTIGVVIPFLTALGIGVAVIYLADKLIGASLVYWICDFIFLGIITFTIAIDTHRVQGIAEGTGLKNNASLAIYGAYQLFVDLIWLYLHFILHILGALILFRLRFGPPPQKK